jgi:hypothetical protein
MLVDNLTRGVINSGFFYYSLCGPGKYRCADLAADTTTYILVLSVKAQFPAII